MTADDLINLTRALRDLPPGPWTMPTRAGFRSELTGAVILAAGSVGVSDGHLVARNARAHLVPIERNHPIETFMATAPLVLPELITRALAGVIPDAMEATTKPIAGADANAVAVIVDLLCEINTNHRKELEAHDRRKQTHGTRNHSQKK